MTWNQLIVYVVKLLKMERKVEENSTDIDELQEQIKALTQDSKSHQSEFQRYRENAERDRRELLLQLQVVLLERGVSARSGLLLEDPEKAELRKQIEALNEQIAALQQQIESKKNETE